LTTGSRLNFELGDIKAMIAALHLILSSAAKYDVEEKVLSLELQQLGLPKDSCNAVCRSYRGAKEKLREHLAANILQLPRLQNVQWRVDHLVRSGTTVQIDAPSVRLKLQTTQPLNANGCTETIELDADQFRALFSELKAARALMESVA
jgi:hypothetical protein